MSTTSKVTLLCVLASLSILAGGALAQDPGVPGPFAVTLTSYNFGNSVFTPTGFPIAVEVEANVHYPTNLAAGPFPLVIFMHGRHYTCYDPATNQPFLQWPCTGTRLPIPSHQGYDYVGNVLASHGYIVVSVSANGINAYDNSVPDLGMLARAELIQHHLQTWQTFNTVGGAPFGTLFVGTVDLTNVGTMGHSRGGEGVVRHYVLNQSLGFPFVVRAVLPIAPVDFNRPIINNVHLGIILPYCDGDVNDLQGVHFYDDARYNVPLDASFKHTFYVMGANHNFYNTNWTPGLFPAGTSDDWFFTTDPFCGTVAGNGRLTPTQQQGTGLAYVTGFFRRYLGGETQFTPMVTGGVPPPPSAQGATIHTSFHAPDAPFMRRDVNRLLTAADLSVNTLGGTVTQSGLAPFALCGGNPPQPQHCLSGQSTSRQPHTTPSFNSPLRGLSQLQLGWSATTASFVNNIPAGQRDVSGFFAVQFRAGIDFTAASNPVGQPQDLTVELTDGLSFTASVQVSSLSGALFYPPGQVASVPKLFLNMVRIPLSAFVGLDLTDVRTVTLRFDQNPTGAINVTDLAFVNPAQALDVDFLVDLSGSFADDLPGFKAQAPGILAALQAFNQNVQFSLGMFVDYPISNFGSAGDKAYDRILQLTPNATTVTNAINGLTTYSGADLPESQLVALFQSATGQGQDLAPQGFPLASIPPGLQVNFRAGASKIFLLWTDDTFHLPGDPGAIPYPGPTFQSTINAILALDPPMVVGISSGGGGVSDLEAVASATGAVAPAGGVDCDEDGVVDVAAGDPLVCTIGATGATGLAEATVSLVTTAADLPPTDSPPTVEILEPVNGSVVVGGEVVILRGVATDPEDGDLSDLITWTSDLDGDLGVGAELAVSLSAGFHTLTASVVDSSGFAGSDSVGVTVEKEVLPCYEIVKVAFEAGAAGWFNDTSSTCKAGTFVIGTPVGEEASGVLTQPDGDRTSGLGNALFTGVTSASRPGDVEGGTCILRSPVYDVTSESTVSLSYFHGQQKSGDDKDDFFLLELSTDGGKSFEPMVSIGDVTTSADWMDVTATVPAGSAIQIRVQVADGPASADLIEAGIDDIVICTK